MYTISGRKMVSGQTTQYQEHHNGEEIQSHGIRYKPIC